MMVSLVFSFGRLYFLTCTSNNEPLQFAGKKWGMLIASQTLRMGRELGCGFGKLRPHFFLFFFGAIYSHLTSWVVQPELTVTGKSLCEKVSNELIKYTSENFFFFFFPWNDPESALGHGDLGPDILNLVSWFLCLPALWSWTKGLKLSNP